MSSSNTSKSSENHKAANTTADEEEGSLVGTATGSKMKNPIIITEILPNDILLGRGALAISNEGNVRFRSIVAERKGEYISTSRRLKKETIANEIRALISSRRGRFLRRVTSDEKLEIEMEKGTDAWAVADEEVVLAKIKQSLRDKEPDERDMLEASQKRAFNNGPLTMDNSKRPRIPSGLDWNAPNIATDRPQQPNLQRGLTAESDSAPRASFSHERALEEELLALRERQRLLLNRSLMFGADMSGGDPMARFRQLDLLSGGGSNPESDQQRLLRLLRGSTDQQDLSQRSQQQQQQDTTPSLDNLRSELELKERRSQMEALLTQREEELLLRRLEQERDASLARLRRQEAMLAAIRQGQLMPSLDQVSSMRDGGFLRDSTDLLGQNALLPRRQVDFSALLGSRLQSNTSFDSLSQSMLGNHRNGDMLSDAAVPRNRKESLDKEDYDDRERRGIKESE